MQKITTKKLVTLALLVAMEVILNRFLSINAWNIKIGFSFVPVAIGAMMLGPLGGGTVGALGDFIGAILFPIGAYFPGFTVTAFLMGMVYGVFFYKTRTTARVLIAVLLNQLILGLFVNSLWISILYGSPYLPLLATRIVQCAILIPIQFAVIRAMVVAAPRFERIIQSEV